MILKMKPWAAAAAALALLVQALPAAAADHPSVRLTVNGQAALFSDASPYVSDDTVLVPIRAAAEHLGLSVAYDSEQSIVTLSTPGAKVSFKAGEGVAFAGEHQIPFAPASTIVSDRVFVPLSFFQAVLGLETDYRADESVADIRAAASALTPEAIAMDIIQLLIDGKYQELWEERFTDDMKAAAPVESLASVWEDTAAMAGSFVGITSAQAAPVGEGILGVDAIVAFEHMSFRVS